MHATDRLLPAWLGALHSGALCVRSHRTSRFDCRCLRAFPANTSRDVKLLQVHLTACYRILSHSHVLCEIASCLVPASTVLSVELEEVMEDFICPQIIDSKRPLHRVNDLLALLQQRPSHLHQQRSLKNNLSITHITMDSLSMLIEACSVAEDVILCRRGKLLHTFVEDRVL